MRASKVGTRTWMLVSDSGRCQPLRYLERNRDRAPRMIARIREVDLNGPPPNPQLFRWLDGLSHRGCRLCEYKVHYPGACRAFAFQTSRGLVIARIEDKTESERKLHEELETVKRAMDEFFEEGERYE